MQRGSLFAIFTISGHAMFGVPNLLNLQAFDNHVLFRFSDQVQFICKISEVLPALYLMPLVLTLLIERRIGV